MSFTLLYAFFYMAAGAMCAQDFSEYLFFDEDAFLTFIQYWSFPLILASFFLGLMNLSTNVYARFEINHAIYAWYLMVAVDYVMAGGIPVLQKFLGGGFLYTDFKPPLHGLTNAISLYIACHLPFLKLKRQYLILGLLVLYQFSILNRGPLIYHLLAFLVGYIVVQIKNNDRHLLFKSMLFFVILMLLFSVVGGFRDVGNAEDIRVVFGINPKFYWMPDALIWLIIYFSSPMSNLIYNLSLGEVTCGSGVSALLSSIIPGFVRNIYLQHDPSLGANLACEITGELYHASLNVSTGFIQYYIDFGILGLSVSALITAFIIRRLVNSGIKKFDAMSSYCIVLLFVSIFAPAYNQLSFIMTFLFIRFCSVMYEAK